MDSGLQDLFARDSDSEEEGNDVRIETIGGVAFELRCAPNDGSSPGALFAYTVVS
jgi:hypothetical protein